MDNSRPKSEFDDLPTGAKIAGAIAAFILFIIVFMLLKPFTIVGPGERGVVIVLGNTQERVMQEGLNWYVPLITKVKKISVRVQRDDVRADAASQDLQDVLADVAVNWHIDPAVVNRTYQRVGDRKDVYDKVIVPAVNETVKSSTAKFKAEEIISKRAELKKRIDDQLVARLKDYGIITDDVSLVNVDFSQEFNQAIEQKQVAEQNVKKAHFIAEKAIKEADEKINRARGESESQRLQQTSLTPLIIQREWIEAWKAGGSKVPTYVGNDSNFFIPFQGAQAQ